MAAEGKNAWLVYEVGYEYLLGLDQYHDKTGAAAMLMAGIILFFANFYPLETTSGMLPLLLHLLDITFLNKVSFYLPLNGAGLLAYQESAGEAILYYGIVLVLGVASILFSFRYIENGYRHVALSRKKHI